MLQPIGYVIHTLLEAVDMSIRCTHTHTTHTQTHTGTHPHTTLVEIVSKSLMHA